VKPGKARKLNYLCNISVDTGGHVITDVQAYHADKKDSQYLQDTVARLNRRLRKEGMILGTPLGRHRLKQWRKLRLSRNQRHKQSLKRTAYFLS